MNGTQTQNDTLSGDSVQSLPEMETSSEIETSIEEVENLVDGDSPSTASEQARAILDLVLTSLDDDKAFDLITIDLGGKSSIGDFLVIATGTSARQVGAMAEHLQEKLKAAGHGPVQVEGMPQCDWVLVDCFDVIVHLFRPEVRSFYNLEKMWGIQGPRGPSRAPDMTEGE